MQYQDNSHNLLSNNNNLVQVHFHPYQSFFSCNILVNLFQINRIFLARIFTILICRSCFRCFLLHSNRLFRIQFPFLMFLSVCFHGQLLTRFLFWNSNRKVSFFTGFLFVSFLTNLYTDLVSLLVFPLIFVDVL